MKFIEKALNFFARVDEFAFGNVSREMTTRDENDAPINISFPNGSEISCEGSLTIRTNGHLFLNSNTDQGKKILLNTRKDENGEPILEDDFNASAEYDHEHETVDELAEEIESLREMVTSLKERIEYLERKTR